MTARLPKIGGDLGEWGSILNEFLEVSHNGDGTLTLPAIKRAGAVTSINTITPVANGNVTLTAANIGGVSIGGDLGGSSSSPTVAKLQGTTVNASTPSDGQVLAYDGVSNSWLAATPSGGLVGDATVSSKGILQLSGDLGNTASSPSVVGIQSVSVSSAAPTAGQVLTASNGTTATWSTPAAAPVQSVAGKTGVVTLATTNLTDVSIASPSNNQVLTYNSGTTKWTNAAPSSGVTTLAADTDVSISGAAAGQALVYNGIAAKWENTALAESNVTNLTSDLAALVPKTTTINGHALSGNVSIAESDISGLTADLAAKAVDTAVVHKTDFAAKGNVLTGTGSGTYTALGVGANGQVLTADSTQTSGVKWAAVSGGGADLPLAGGTMEGWLAPAVVALSQSSGTVAVNAALGNDFRLTLTASGWTIAAPSNPADGQDITVSLTQDATGGRTIDWASAWYFGTIGAPVLSTAGAATDILAFKYFSSVSQWVYLGSTADPALSLAGGTMEGALIPAVVTLTDASTVAVNAALGNDFRLLTTAAIGSTRAIAAPSNPADGQKITIDIRQPTSGGPCSVTWATGTGGYDFGTDGAPTLSTTASAIDEVGFRYRADLDKWTCMGWKLGF